MQAAYILKGEKIMKALPLIPAAPEGWTYKSKFLTGKWVKGQEGLNNIAVFIHDEGKRVKFIEYVFTETIRNADHTVVGYIVNDRHSGRQTFHLYREYAVKHFNLLCRRHGITKQKYIYVDDSKDVSI